MTRGNRVLASVLTLGTLMSGAATVYAQQQFGPSPQAMYKQHPGTAPTYVNYGEPTVTPQIAALHAGAPAATPRPAAHPAMHAATAPRTVAHRKAAPSSTPNSGR
jgi:hypothetical protein